MIPINHRHSVLMRNTELVRLHAKRCPRNRNHEFRHARSCLLWQKSSMDHNRPDIILQQVEASGAKDPNRQGTMGMHETRPSQSFHRRTTSDLALPPNGCLLRHGYRCSVPFLANNLRPNRDLLCLGGYMALLDAPSLSLRLLLQERP